MSIERQTKLMKQRSVNGTNAFASGTATEHAAFASGTATEHAAFASGTSTEQAAFVGGTATEHATSGKDPHLEKMFQEACSNAPRNMEILLQELHALGRYPNRYKQPAGEVEKDSNRLAKKLATARSSFTPAVQKYVEELALAGYVEQAQRKRPASEALMMKSLAPAITAHSHSAATEHV